MKCTRSTLVVHSCHATIAAGARSANATDCAITHRMEVKHLRTFAAAAAENSFTRAADTRKITQAAVSQHVAALEQELARPLFDRTGRTVSLGAVYATLDRLEKKGYVKSNKRKAGAERQGRAKRIFRVKPSGLTALRRTIECLEKMREGLPELGGAT